jgi:hypothetical protein
MGPFVIAWMIGEGTIAYWDIAKNHVPPSPGKLLVGSGVFALLAVIASASPGARTVATLTAFGFDIAAFLQGYQGKPTTTPFPAAGSAGNTQIFPDGGSGGAATVSSTSPSGSTGTSTDYASSTGDAGSGGSATANQQIAQQIIAANPQFAGWGTGANWSGLVSLWNQESGWSASAQNPGSGALGIAQALGHSTSGSGEYGGYGLTAAQAAAANAGSAAAQILWGLNYILDTYGSPAAAWQHEQANNWY